MIDWKYVNKELPKKNGRYLISINSPQYFSSCENNDTIIPVETITTISRVLYFELGKGFHIESKKGELLFVGKGNDFEFCDGRSFFNGNCWEDLLETITHWAYIDRPNYVK